MKSLILLSLAIFLVCAGIGIMFATVFADNNYDSPANRQKILKIVGFLFGLFVLVCGIYLLLVLYGLADTTWLRTMNMS